MARKRYYRRLAAAGLRLAASANNPNVTGQIIAVAGDFAEKAEQAEDIGAPAALAQAGEMGPLEGTGSAGVPAENESANASLPPKLDT